MHPGFVEVLDDDQEPDGSFFLALELLQGVYGSTGIAHFAHLGGMLGGWLTIRYWRGQAPFPSRRRR